MKTALVTGHKGFIGRHIIEALSSTGYETAGIDIEDGLDCRDYFNEPAQRADRWDLVVHCAAVIGGRAKIDGDPLAVAENLAIDSDMFRWAVRTKQPRVVYFSSSAAYPIDLQIKGTDSTLAEGDIGGGCFGLPDNTYGLAKLVGEQLAKKAAEAGVKVHVFRPFSGYGEDQSHDYPFNALNEKVAFAVAERNREVEVWGDPTSKRDWIHIDDIVDAVLTAVDQDFLEPVNLCTGIGTSFEELVWKMAANLNSSVTIQANEDAPMGVHTRVGDPELMHTFYTPKVSLIEGIARCMS